MTSVSGQKGKLVGRRIAAALVWLHASFVNGKLGADGGAFVGSRRLIGFRPRCSTVPCHLTPSERDNESLEAVQSMVEFHDGKWQGRATSFTVSADVAAGILRRKESPEYRSSVKLGMSDSRELSVFETFEWDDKISSRSTSLIQSNFDVDSVDASYSLDMTLPNLPAELTGTNALLQFGIEHCIAVSDDERVRCFVLYGVDQSLARVVVCDERKVREDDGVSSNSGEDLLALDSDVDRIVDKIAGQIQGEGSSKSPASRDSKGSSDENKWSRLQSSMSSTTSNKGDGNDLARHPMSLLEITSGIWLGDSIIRDIPSVRATPFGTGSGFGDGPKNDKQDTPSVSGTGRSQLAGWELGVQKSAWQWIWDFGSEIRQQHDTGKVMGSEMAKELSKSLSGSVCVNESLSRRIPKESRMIYFDWNNGDYVGSILGSVSIQVPRFITFNRAATKNVKPFFTEVCVFQASSARENELPDVCCSKMARVYNFEGKLKQGCTAFYTLNRFGVEEDTQ